MKLFDFSDEFKKIERDGYVILKKCVLKKKINKLLKKTIIPILHKKKIYLTKKQSWKRRSGRLIYGKYGDHIIDRNNSHFRFKGIFNSKKLINFINQYHTKNYNKTNKTKWRFNLLASEGLGWIHLRYPFKKYNNSNNNNNNNNNKNNNNNNNNKIIPVKYGFHLDGIDEEINPTQSLVILPFITDVKQLGGGTAIIPGSHKLINDYIHSKKSYKVDLLDKINNIVDNNNKNNIIEAIGNKGDILILHPHLIHSSSYADIKSKVRITFNLSTEII
jgi:hypothetical protein